MNVKELKEMLSNYSDDSEVMYLYRGANDYTSFEEMSVDDWAADDWEARDDKDAKILRFFG